MIKWWACACLTMSLNYGVASADTTTIYSSGLWETFGGTDVDGNEVCGMSTWRGRQGLQIKRYEKAADLVIQVSNADWSISEKSVPVTMQLDGNRGWAANAIVGTSRRMIEFSVPVLKLNDFFRELTTSRAMYLSMGTNSVQWTITLNGLQNAIQSFNECVGMMSD